MLQISEVQSQELESCSKDVAVGSFPTPPVGTSPTSSWSSLFLSHTAWVRNRLPWLSLLTRPALFLLHLPLSWVDNHPNLYCFSFLKQGLPHVMKVGESTAMASPLPPEMGEELAPVGSEPGTNG